MDLRGVLIGLVVASPAYADFAADEYPPYERCALCHGLFGVSHTGKFPNLAGQKPAYLAEQIDAFRDGHRTNDGGQMSAIVTELKPEEIPVVVDWFSGQEPPAPAELDGAEAGAQPFADLGCAACHFEADSSAPHLTAQHVQYLSKQMQDFRAKRRTSDLHASLLQDAPIAAIAAYLSAQRRP